MPSIKDFAAPDETKAIRIELVPTRTNRAGVFARVEYRRNLVNLEFDTGHGDGEPEEVEADDAELISFSTTGQAGDNRDAAEISTRLSDLLVAWDLTGPITNRRGELLVGDGEPVPVAKPEIIRCLPLWVISRVYQAIVQAESPNPQSSRKP